MDLRLKRAATISALREHMGRVIVVSNRLPVSASYNEETDKWTFKMSSGGLVAGLEGVKKKLPFLWIGWTGQVIPKEQQKSFEEQLLAQHNCIPVYLDEKVAEEFYNGFSNGVLWPLFHYLLEESGSSYREHLWKSYLTANQAFADVVSKHMKPTDLVWVHDYHLMKMPEMLRKLQPTVRLGFFLHIPFPTSEIYQIIPVRNALLQGVLNCDMIGFHTYDYARHFITACGRLLGCETTPAGVHYEGKFIPLIISPVGIDPEKFEAEIRTEGVENIIKDFKTSFEGKKIFLAVDRLDYIKGIPHRLRAFQLMLQTYPEWRGKAILIQVAVPSRTDVDQYKKLKIEVETLVGHINGEYGDLNYQPIHYLFKSTPFPELCALYRISDAALVTSIRDGMNLVAQEYIACQQDKHGVLILSEFAGSASSLSGAYLVNPWNTHALANAMHDSITMSEEEKKARFDVLSRYVHTHTACNWGESFIKDLDRVSKAASLVDKTPKLTLEGIKEKYSGAQKRLIVLASDGALIAYASLPFLASPSRKLTDVLNKLAKDERNIIYISSGRDRATLEQWFGNLPVGLAAEHGFFFKPNEAGGAPQGNPLQGSSGSLQTVDENGWIFPGHVDLSWMTRIVPILQHFTERTPGSFFEEKETSLTWHYRSTDRETSFGAFRAQELRNVLDNTTTPAQVIMGEKSVEVRPFESSNSNMLKKIINKHPDHDLVLYIGEPTNMDFSNMPQVIDCGVGRKSQEFFLPDTTEVLKFLEKLAAEGNN